MLGSRNLMAAIIVVALSASFVWAAEKPATTSPASPAVRPATVNETYPGLASGVLTHAKLFDLPKATLLKAGELSVSEKDVNDEMAKAPKDIQEQLKKNAFFLLEQMAARRLVLRAAQAHAAKAGKDPSKGGEREIVQGYFSNLVAKARVTDEEIADFYRKNESMFGVAKLEQVKRSIGQYLLQQKQQEVVSRHIRTMGQRTPIQVSASWAKIQAPLAKDNPVDKVRNSGRPSLVDFTAVGCPPCKMMAPILAALKKKYAGKVNVELVHVRKEQILALRYGVQSVPVQIFFDKDGREVFRHTGFYGQAEIEKKLAEMGVK